MAENCRAAYARIGETCHREPVPVGAKGPAYDAWREELADAQEEFNDLEFEMFETGPRTKTGAAAMIRYHLEINSDLLDAEEPLLRSLLSYLDAAVQS
jgi:hypothetical protein